MGPFDWEEHPLELDGYVHFTISDEDLFGRRPTLPDPTAQLSEAWSREFDRWLVGDYLIPAARRWQANGHPRPLRIDGASYRRRSRGRRGR